MYSAVKPPREEDSLGAMYNQAILSLIERLSSLVRKLWGFYV